MNSITPHRGGAPVGFLTELGPLTANAAAKPGKSKASGGAKIPCRVIRIHFGSLLHMHVVFGWYPPFSTR